LDPAIFAQLDYVPNRQTDTQTTLHVILVAADCIYALHACNVAEKLKDIIIIIIILFANMSHNVVT